MDLFTRFYNFIMGNKSENTASNLDENSYNTSDIRELMSEIQDLKTQNKITRNKIENLSNENGVMRWIIGTIVAILALFLPILLTMFNNNISHMFSEYNTAVNSKFDIILNEIRNGREQNYLQIQRDISSEILKQSSNRKK